MQFVVAPGDILTAAGAKNVAPNSPAVLWMAPRSASEAASRASATISIATMRASSTGCRSVSTSPRSTPTASRRLCFPTHGEHGRGARLQPAHQPHRMPPGSRAPGRPTRSTTRTPPTARPLSTRRRTASSPSGCSAPRRPRQSGAVGQRELHGAPRPRNFISIPRHISRRQPWHRLRGRASQFRSISRKPRNR